MIMQRSLAVLILSLFMIGCSGAEKDADNAVTVKLPPVEGTGAGAQQRLSRLAALRVKAAPDGSNANPDSAQADSVRSSRYTSLEPASCDLLGAMASKNFTVRRRCAGPSGYALEAMQSDTRQDLAIISSDGSRSELNLPRLATGGTFGKLAEWRGPASGQPRALIVRVSKGTKSHGPSNLGDLVVARLVRPACIVAVVRPGPGQNERARAAADREPLKCSKG